MGNLSINNGGIVTNKEGMPSIDFRYGPYASLSAAHAALSADGLCAIGLTVGIINGNKVDEYWYQEGIELSNLVKKAKVDSAPTKDSPNAVSSGGVYDVTHGTLKTRYIPFDLRGESIIFLSDEDMTELFGPATMVGGQSMFDLTVGQYQHVYRVTNSKSEVFEIPAAYHNANGARHIVGINGNLTIELSFTITNGVYVNAAIAKRETSIPGISYEEEQDLTDAQRRTAQQNIGLEKGVVDGVASLDDSGKIPINQIPEEVSTVATESEIRDLFNSAV